MDFKQYFYVFSDNTDPTVNNTGSVESLTVNTQSWFSYQSQNTSQIVDTETKLLNTHFYKAQVQVNPGSISPSFKLLYGASNENAFDISLSRFLPQALS